MRAPLRRFVPIGSLPKRTTVDGAPMTASSAPLLVVTSGTALRARVNQPSHSRRNILQVQSQSQQSLRQVFCPHPQELQLLQPQLLQHPPPPSKKLAGAMPLPADGSATYRAFFS